MSDDTIKKLGTIRSQDEGRDAIHIAVLTMRATENIRTSVVQYVTAEGERVDGTDPRAVGIIDPFLFPKTIRVGDWFYVYLKPASITGLQHVWSHPAFPPAQTTLPSEGTVVAMPNMEVFAEARVRGFCADMGIDYDDFLDVLGGDGRSGCLERYAEYIIVHGHDAHGEIPEAILADVETILGRRLRHAPTSFSCSC